MTKELLVVTSDTSGGLSVLLVIWLLPDHNSGGGHGNCLVPFPSLVQIAQARRAKEVAQCAVKAAQPVPRDQPHDQASPRPHEDRSVSNPFVHAPSIEHPLRHMAPHCVLDLFIQPLHAITLCETMFNAQIKFGYYTISCFSHPGDFGLAFSMSNRRLPRPALRATSSHDQH